MEPKDDRDALFAVIRELETLHTNCVNKANADLKAILAWVPPGPMSRRTDN